MTPQESAMESKLSAMSPMDLENRRREIVTSANGKYESLSTEMLQELAFITSTLRRRNSGPPKATKALGSPKSKPTIDNLLDF